jgi:beta-lactamase class A
MIADYRGGKVGQKRRRFPFILIITVVFFLYAILLIVNASTTTVLSPVPNDVRLVPTASSRNNPKKSPDELRTIIQNAVGTTWVNYSVLVSDFNTDFRMAINGSEIYDAASVNKIPILAALYATAAKGDVDMDRIITIQAQDIQDYGTGVIRYQPPGTTYSIKTLAQLMMQKSDNTAAYILANHVVGLKNIQSLVNAWGLTQTDITENTTSNNDMAILMGKMYRGEITDKAHTDEMLSQMKDSDFEARIPGELPKGVTVYHKIGNQVGVIHDVGIVSAGKTLYYVGFLTSNLTDEPGAETLEATLSKLVYDFMRGL